ncbi:HNH endonuclease [Photobacterium leiognathi]|uniref:HNH endonuclease n=1 Tax=Photobacterium leiognathi TaxID=553611 RepID=UPI00298120AE|nr:HNH endonuclease [Photobacterium leiognathi]
MKKESRTAFVNRIMGLSFKSTQGKYSYCNDTKKQVLFSLNSANGNVILSPAWSKKGYAHSLKHINKIKNDGYELLIFKTSVKKNKKGETVADGFSPVIEQRQLVIEKDIFKAIPLDVFQPDEIPEDNENIYEGAMKTIKVNAYERDIKARKICLEHFGYLCKVCEFDFEKVYGERGKNFIHVHHIIPLSEIKSEYKLDPIKDLIPVCPNCHAMLHRYRNTILPQELKVILTQKIR